MANVIMVKTSTRKTPKLHSWGFFYSLIAGGAESSKRQAQGAQAIGKRLVCENVPQIKLEEHRCAADVDRQGAENRPPTA